MGVNIRWGTKGQSVSLCRNIIIWDSCVQGNIIYLLCKCILYFQIIRVFFTSWETRALINTFSLTSSILEWVPLGVGKKWQKQRQFTKLLIGPEEKKKNLTPVFRYRQHIVSSDVYTKPDWVQKQIRRSLEETEAQTRQREEKKVWVGKLEKGKNTKHDRDNAWAGIRRKNRRNYNCSYICAETFMFLLVSWPDRISNDLI